MSDVADPDQGKPLTEAERATALALLGTSGPYVPCEACAGMSAELARSLGRSTAVPHRATWSARVSTPCHVHDVEEPGTLLLCRPCQRAVVNRAPWTCLVGVHGVPVPEGSPDRYIGDTVTSEWLPLFGPAG